MKTIWKYELVSGAAIEMPAGARILHVGEQRGTLFAWAIVDTAAPTVGRTIVVRGTGRGLADKIADLPYLGTVENPRGLVWHLFDGGEQ